MEEKVNYEFALKNKVFTAVLSLNVTLTSTSALAMPIFAGSKPNDEIIILYTNDLHVSVDDNIGYAGITLCEKQLHKDNYITIGDAIPNATICTIS